MLSQIYHLSGLNTTAWETPFAGPVHRHAYRRPLLLRQDTDRQARKQKRAVIFKRAEQYVNEYKAAEREQIRQRRLAKSKGDFYVPAQPRVAFVVRLRGISNIPPKPKKIMQLLRLRQINNGCFVKLTNATQQMLQLIQPYVTYGEPNLKSIRELIYKRGYAKINRQRIPITDNSVIEEHLGKYGIISVEDLVHEIATVGPNFKAVNNLSLIHI